MNENLVLESLPVQVERHQSTDLVIQVYPIVYASVDGYLIISMFWLFR